MTAANAATDLQPPAIETRETDAGVAVHLSGDWTLRALCPHLDELRARLTALARDDAHAWDLSAIHRLDNTGALILWKAWGRTFPSSVALRDSHRPVFANWETRQPPHFDEPRRPPSERALATLARPARAAHHHARDWLALLARFLRDVADLLAHPRRIPWREISAIIHLTGVRALPITGILGLLFGVVLAYQAAIHLQAFGADTFVSEMVGFTMVREMGPSMTAIILAGRSGSAITAQIGVMRLTQELDAMKVMGISSSQRILLPRIIGLTIVLPLLSIWVMLLSLSGGALTAHLAIGLDYTHFFSTLPTALPLVNLWIGLAKAALFGAAIAITACHFGLRIEPNTRSLAAETTRSVVAGIALVIIINASATVVLQNIGFKGV